MSKKEKKERVLPEYTLGEELFSSISHGIGSCLAIAGCVMLIVFAAIHGNAWSVVGGAIYGATLIILYTMSTLYHAIVNKKAKYVFRVFDHTSIFLLIAGTYTPVTLVTLRNVNKPLAWTVFGIVWLVAILGIIFNAVSIEKSRVFSMIAYIVSGWAIVIGFRAFASGIDSRGMWLMVAGGVAYTVGIIFYAMKKIRYMHSVWHFFVLAGSILQYFSILFYVIPQKG